MRPDKSSRRPPHERLGVLPLCRRGRRIAGSGQKRHALRYRTYALLVDLDELPDLDRRLKFFSHNRFNIFGLHDRDYGTGEGKPLREAVEDWMREAGLEPDGGAIRLLTMPRILGYAFNPLSLYFCHARDGALRAILYEVNNTFGQRHDFYFSSRRAGRQRDHSPKLRQAALCLALHGHGYVL